MICADLCRKYIYTYAHTYIHTYIHTYADQRPYSESKQGVLDAWMWMQPLLTDLCKTYIHTFIRSYADQRSHSESKSGVLDVDGASLDGFFHVRIWHNSHVCVYVCVRMCIFGY